MNISFGTAESYLREGEHRFKPDTELDLKQGVMVIIGAGVYLPHFHLTIHEGLICYEKQEREWKPEYMVTAIFDKESGELLCDEEGEFVECVFHWQEGKVSLEELEKERCEIEGILTCNQKRDSDFKEERQNGKNSYCR